MRKVRLPELQAEIRRLEDELAAALEQLTAARGNIVTLKDLLRRSQESRAVFFKHVEALTLERDALRFNQRSARDISDAVH